jgi:upstream activation factor subunit UAF30
MTTTNEVQALRAAAEEALETHLRSRSAEVSKELDIMLRGILGHVNTVMAGREAAWGARIDKLEALIMRRQQEIENLLTRCSRVEAIARNQGSSSLRVGKRRATRTAEETLALVRQLVEQWSLVHTELGHSNGANGRKGAPRGLSKSKFMQPLLPSPQLALVIGPSPLPRTEAIKRFWKYIKKHNLQDPQQRRLINANAELRPLFDGQASVSMFELPRILNRHLLSLGG